MYGEHLAWSLRHRRGRHVMNAITMMITASVVIVFASVTAMIIKVLRQSSEGEVMRMLVLPKVAGRDAELPLALHPQFKKIPGVKSLQRWHMIGGRHPSGVRYHIVGEEDEGIEYNLDLLPVEPAVFDAWKRERLAAIVAEGTAHELNLRVGEPAEIITAAGPLKVKVVGISRGGLIFQRIAVHYDYLNEFLGNPGTARYRIFAKPDDYDRVSHTVDELTKNSASPAQAVSAASFAASLVKRAAMVPAVLGFLGIFLIFTTALTLANNCAISVRERRMETATLRVLGYHRRTIVLLLIGESVLVGLAGGLVAIAVTWVLFRNGVQLTPGERELLEPVKVKLPGILAGGITSIVVPFMGALPSAIRSVRLTLVKALRDLA